MLVFKRVTGSGQANYIYNYSRTSEKIPLFRPYIALFRGKKCIIQNNFQWQERKDAIFQGRFGISSIIRLFLLYILCGI